MSLKLVSKRLVETMFFLLITYHKEGLLEMLYSKFFIKLFLLFNKPQRYNLSQRRFVAVVVVLLTLLKLTILKLISKLLIENMFVLLIILHEKTKNSVENSL